MQTTRIFLEKGVLKKRAAFYNVFMTEIPALTGTHLNYLLVCHRKLWLYSRGIQMERENEDVQIGKQIGAQAYGREQKEINLDNTAVLDWVEHKTGADGVLTVHEIKKSKAMNEAHRLQMLFYLDTLKSKGVAARGLIDYPEIKQRESVELDAAGEQVLAQAKLDAARVMAADEVPPRLDQINPRKLAFCLKCAYFDFCYSDELQNNEKETV